MLEECSGRWASVLCRQRPAVVNVGGWFADRMIFGRGKFHGEVFQTAPLCGDDLQTLYAILSFRTERLFAQRERGNRFGNDFAYRRGDSITKDGGDLVLCRGLATTRVL